MPTENRARTANVATPKVAAPPAVAPGIKLPPDQKLAFHPVETVHKLPPLVPPGIVIGLTPAPAMPPGFRVNCTDEASARNSRLRQTAA